MASGDFVLQFDLKEGEFADAIIAAESLIAWVKAMQEAARVLDPNEQIRVEIIASEQGSLKHLLRVVEEFVGDVKSGAGEYPNLRALAIGVALATGPVLLDHMLPSGTQTVELSEQDRQLLRDMQNRIRQDKATETATKRFYRTVEKDHAVTAIRVGQQHESEPQIVIPRSQFPDRGGLWDLEELPAPEEARHAVWNVVLLRASFTHEPRAWTFSRDGLPFSAKMEDPDFLAAIAAKTVPITLQEGVMMQIEVEYRERLDGQVWKYVERTRKVIRVLSPRPLASPSLASGPPKEDN